MTVATTHNVKQHDGNGSTWEWTYDFPIIDDVDLEVYITDASGNDTTLALNTDYIVTGAGSPSGGTVEYPIGGSGTLLPDDGSYITISRAVAQTQGEDLTNQVRIVASRWEVMADKLTLICQDLQAQIDRALLSPVTAPGSETALTETAADLRYMRKIGGAFSGEPTYASDPSVDDALTRKSWVVNNYVPKAGGVTLTGDLLRTSDPGSGDALARASFVLDFFDPDTGHRHDDTDGRRVEGEDIATAGGNNGEVLTVDDAGVAKWEERFVANGPNNSFTLTSGSTFYTVVNKSIELARDNSYVLMEFSFQLTSAASVPSDEIIDIRFASSAAGTTVYYTATNAVYINSTSDNFRLPLVVRFLMQVNAAGSFPVYVQACRPTGTLVEMTNCILSLHVMG